MPENLRDNRRGRRGQGTPGAGATATPGTEETPAAADAATTSGAAATAPAQGTQPLGLDATKARERRRQAPVVKASEAKQESLTQAAAVLLGKEEPKKNPAKVQLTPFNAEKLKQEILQEVNVSNTNVTNTTNNTVNTTTNNVNVTVVNQGAPTPTPVPARITVEKTVINNIIQNVTLVPTPPPAPTPGPTPVPPPPGVTPIPMSFVPPGDWIPYPGWNPPMGWKPPSKWVPPGGWTPPPGWEPPDEQWRRRVESWGWRYLARRGWVVDVRWVPPPDFVVPPNWYYMPPTAYDDYGFYNPAEVVVLPGKARPDLVVQVNVQQPYTPPVPPPAIIEEMPPPPPRVLPAAPPPPVRVQEANQVVEVLSRPRRPDSPRYEGPVLVTESVHFDYDSYAIKPESFPALDQIGEALIAPPLDDAIINVEGHTDADGSDEYNQKLSEQRAWSVKSYLVQQFGIDPNRLVIVGYGERAPIASNNSDQGKARNRRVEFENVTDLYKAQVLETANAQ